MSLSTIILETGGVFETTVNQDGSGNLGVNVKNFPVIQSVSGTVAAPLFTSTIPVSIWVEWTEA
jgi:hypothetical protein